MIAAVSPRDGRPDDEQEERRGQQGAADREAAFKVQCLPAAGGPRRAVVQKGTGRPTVEDAVGPAPVQAHRRRAKQRRVGREGERERGFVDDHLHRRVDRGQAHVDAIADGPTHAGQAHQAGPLQRRDVGPHVAGRQHHADLAFACRVERQIQHRLHVPGRLLRARRRRRAAQERQCDEAGDEPLGHGIDDCD